MAGLDDRDLVQLFVDDLPDYAIVTLDVAGKIRTWNAGARALLGYTADEVVGRNFSELYSKVDLVTARSTASMSDAVQWGRHETTGQLVRKDGTRLEARIVLRPLSHPLKSLSPFRLIASAVR